MKKVDLGPEIDPSAIYLAAFAAVVIGLGILTVLGLSVLDALSQNSFVM